MTDTDFNYGENETEKCQVTIECPSCRAIFGYCSDLRAILDWFSTNVKTYYDQEVNLVLPSGDDSTTTQSSGSRRRREGGMVYLTNEMLSKTPKEAKILAVKLDTENRYGARVILKLALEGKTVFWGVNIKKNPNYRTLEHKFGRDENDWINQKIHLALEEEEFSGNYFPTVSFPAAGGKK